MKKSNYDYVLSIPKKKLVFCPQCGDKGIFLSVDEWSYPVIKCENCTTEFKYHSSEMRDET